MDPIAACLMSALVLWVVVLLDMADVTIVVDRRKPQDGPGGDA